MLNSLNDPPYLGGNRHWSANHDTPPDAVVLIRGGGAVNDLAWLNDYALAKLICELRVPLLTGIGHERDSTVLDEVAHTKFDTPSKVIAGIEQVIKRRALEAQHAYAEITRAAELTLQKARLSVQRFDTAVRSGARQQIDVARRTSAEHLTAVKGVSVETLINARSLAKEKLAAIRQDAARVLTLAKTKSSTHHDFVLERASSHVLRTREVVNANIESVRQGAMRAVQEAKTKSESLIREITGQGPSKTLARGFAMIRDPEGKPVTRAEQVQSGQTVEVQFSDGAVSATMQKDAK